MAAMVASTATSFSYHKVSASFPQTIYCSVHAAIVVRGELNHLINATRFSRDSRWSAGRRTGTGTGTGSGRSGRRSTSTRSRSSRSRRRRGASASAASPPYVVSAIPCLCLVLNSEFSYAWVMGALHMHKPDHTTIDTLELNSLVNKNKRGNAYAQCTSLIIKKTFKSLLKFENEKTYLTYLKKKRIWILETVINCGTDFSCDKWCSIVPEFSAPQFRLQSHGLLPVYKFDPKYSSQLLEKYRLRQSTS